LFNALHDSLTGLPNRALFLDRLNQAIVRIKRQRDYRFGVLYLDFDRFKLINDSLGHNIGDLLLIASSRRLESTIRAIDTVARLGGDEFVILLDGIHGEQDAIFVANRILAELGVPFQLEGFQVFNSASVGIVMSGPEYEKPEEILRDADIAMYQAKQGRGGRYAVFDTEMREKTRTRMEIETNLRVALERGEIYLQYQPLVVLENGKLNGFEALLRWKHPVHGNIPPDRFIPVAEETGLIYPLGRWVLQTACKQMRNWLDRFPDAKDLHINVNVSPRQLAQSTFAQEVLDILVQADLATSGLQLEITETALIEESDVVSDNLVRLNSAGVFFHLDDFGTGYSSLSYLNRYPIHSLKIDSKFVTRIGPEGKSEEIVRTILTMARELNLPVVAEGVETTQQLNFLQALNCQYGQGYLISRPLNVDKAEEMFLQKTPQPG
jgi:diguanylate cyclase (GGDEF)-like protein